MRPGTRVVDSEGDTGTVLREENGRVIVEGDAAPGREWSYGAPERLTELAPIDDWLPAFAGLVVEGEDLAEALRANLDPDAGNRFLVPGAWFEAIAARIRALEQQRAGATWVTAPTEAAPETDFERRLRELEQREKAAIEEAWPT